MEAKADPNVQDNKGRTPLHYVAYFGCNGSIDLLLKGEAKYNILDK
ncbi:MAG: ankyrin repeat domain-containing protein [Wolbachia sp.]